MGQRKKSIYCNGINTTDKTVEAKYHCQSSLSIKLVRIENDAELLTWISNHLKTNLTFLKPPITNVQQGTTFHKNKTKVKNNIMNACHNKNKKQPVIVKSKIKQGVVNQKVRKPIISFKTKFKNVNDRSRICAINYRNKRSRNSKVVISDEPSVKRVKKESANIQNQSSSDESKYTGLDDMPGPSVPSVSHDFFVTNAVNSPKEMKDIDVNSKVDCFENRSGVNKSATSLKFETGSENHVNGSESGSSNRRHKLELSRNNSNRVETKTDLCNVKNSKSTSKNTFLQLIDDLSKLKESPGSAENTELASVENICERNFLQEQCDSKSLSHGSSLHQQNMERPTVNNSTKETVSTFRTMYDLMDDVAAIIPSWNLHILPDTNTFCISQVTRNKSGIPYLSKCIEIDDNFNAKVYIYEQHCKKFDGIYDSESTVAELIKAVNNFS